MNQSRIFISSSSHALPPSGIPGCSIAHLDYTIGPGKRLMRSSRSRSFRGGLLVISDRDMPTGNSDLLVSELVRECQIRGYMGVVASFEKADPMLSTLQDRLNTKGLRLYVPQALGGTCPKAHVICSTAISGGSLKTRLQELGDKYGTDRMALDIQRLAMDFLLPSPTGDGTALSQDELKGLLKRRGAQCFFSGDLCSYYFTYSESGTHHFVLFDTDASIRKKLSVAQALGIGEAFLMYSEVEDILTKIV